MFSRRYFLKFLGLGIPTVVAAQKGLLPTEEIQKLADTPSAIKTKIYFSSRQEGKSHLAQTMWPGMNKRHTSAHAESVAKWSREMKDEAVAKVLWESFDSVNDDDG